MSSEESKPPSTAARAVLSRWINKSLKITMSDGRILVGVFLCVDRDCNVIVGNCSEYLNEADLELWADARILGLALVPGRHIVRICEDTYRVEQAYSRSVVNGQESQPPLPRSTTDHKTNNGSGVCTNITTAAGAAANVEPTNMEKSSSRSSKPCLETDWRSGAETETSNTKESKLPDAIKLWSN
ncbi:LSM domain-containing protein 1-like [Tropilaelaps mercedesae]|uniref:LSM domain-containing protein 1-like n=1 Tax=Tropilaelaps mercedesae TaxID=418985 RepID=A0A1V9XQ28_9ACAR|nr:LSM domain-containing protein 1-like [Tropilaelaps mercedesae]